MARQNGRWYGGWDSPTWASARGLWKKPTPEEEETDNQSWRAAACEDGGFLQVLWCELCQLFGDILPRQPSAEPVASAIPDEGDRTDA